MASGEIYWKVRPLVILIWLATERKGKSDKMEFKV